MPHKAHLLNPKGVLGAFIVSPSTFLNKKALEKGKAILDKHCGVDLHTGVRIVTAAGLVTLAERSNSEPTAKGVIVAGHVMVAAMAEAAATGIEIMGNQYFEDCFNAITVDTRLVFKHETGYHKRAAEFDKSWKQYSEKETLIDGNRPLQSTSGSYVKNPSSGNGNGNSGASNEQSGGKAGADANAQKEQATVDPVIVEYIPPFPLRDARLLTMDQIRGLNPKTEVECPVTGKTVRVEQLYNNKNQAKKKDVKKLNHIQIPEAYLEETLVIGDKMFVAKLVHNAIVSREARDMIMKAVGKLAKADQSAKAEADKTIKAKKAKLTNLKASVTKDEETIKTLKSAIAGYSKNPEQFGKYLTAAQEDLAAAESRTTEYKKEIAVLETELGTDA